MNYITRDKIIIAIFSFLFIFGALIVFTKRKKSNLLPDGSKLKLSEEFYKRKYQETLNYLIAVYPTAEKSFRKMDSIQLAVFYNSLWFYYNCEASFDKVFGVNNIRYCWQPLAGCGDTWPKLPYAPQGYLYSFQDWISDWIPWIYSDSTKPASYFTNSIPGVTLWTWFQGPGQLFAPQRAITRNVYDTELPKVNDDLTKKYTVPKIPNYITWNYPRNWWKGTRFVEVTYSDIVEMGSGAMVWWNSMYGTGVFLDVSKCKIARNKADGAFQLAVEMALTKRGKEKLKEWYYTYDPYEIIAGLLLSPCRQEGAWVWEPNSGKKVQFNFCKGAGTPFMGIPNTPDGWNSTPVFDGKDWYQWCGKVKADTRTNNIPNECINKIISGSNYMADRITSQSPFDEAMTCMGAWLGYDTIQLIYSANDTGFWQIEMLELRGLPDEVKERDYSKFLEVRDNNIHWRQDNGFITHYMNSIHSYLSMRDPTDVLNETSAQKCVSSKSWLSKTITGKTWNAVCKNNLSDMLSNLSLDGNPRWNQCSSDKNFFPFG